MSEADLNTCARFVGTQPHNLTAVFEILRDCEVQGADGAWHPVKAGDRMTVPLQSESLRAGFRFRLPCEEGP